MNRVAAAIGLAVAAASVLTACVPSSGPLAFQPKSDAGYDALLSGTLHIDEDCVWVEAEGDDYIPVFRIGDARMEAGELVYARRYGDGATIEIPGGETAVAGEGWYVPSGCPDLMLWNAAPQYEA